MIQTPLPSYAISKRERQKQETIRMVAETIMYGLKEAEALRYFQVKTGRSIKHAHYWRVRRFIESSEANDIWINHHAKVGFVYNLRKRIDVMDRQIEDTLQMILVEKSKSMTGIDQGTGAKVPRRNDWLVLALKKELRAELEFAVSLDGASPIVAKVRAMLTASKASVARENGTGEIDPKDIEMLWEYYKIDNPHAR